MFHVVFVALGAEQTDQNRLICLSELHEYIYCFNVILICSASSATAASHWCNEPHQNPEQVWFWSNM